MAASWRPRTGTSIGSAREIDRLARDLASTIIRQRQADTLGDIRDPQYAVHMPHAIARLLNLREAPRWGFRVTPRGADIEVKPVDLLIGWLAGTSLPDLAETHLAAAPSPSWRIEQMVDAVTSHFEHYLAWTLGALVEMVNARLADAESDDTLCPDLGSYIRYGVHDPRALILMTSGIRSRRLTHAIVTDLPTDLEATCETLRPWIATIGVAGWRSRYQASASEVLDLLDFTRPQGRSLLKTLLETGTVSVDLPTTTFALPSWDGPLILEHLRGEPQPASLAIYSGEQHIATMAAQDHIDLSAIVDTGLDITLEIDQRAPRPALSITLPFSDTMG